MDNKNDELSKIKNSINENIKIIDIKFNGSKSNKKLINISPILKAYSEKLGLPEIEKYKFFDLENIKYNIENSYISAEDKVKKLKHIHELEQEYKKFELFLEFIQKQQVRINGEYICGMFHRYKVINKENLEDIYSIQKEINKEKDSINKSVLNQVINECRDAFIYNIKEELIRHDIDPNEVSKDMKDMLQFTCNPEKYLDNINLQVNIVMDISHEILSNTLLKNELRDLNLIAEVRESIEKYYELSQIPEYKTIN